MTLAQRQPIQGEHFVLAAMGLQYHPRVAQPSEISREEETVARSQMIDWSLCVRSPQATSITY